MATMTEYAIDGIPLFYGSFRWPLYRGVRAREVVVEQPAFAFPMFQGLPRKVTLTITAPAGPGKNPAETKLQFQNIRVLRVVKVNDLRMEIHLADARADLAERLTTKDANLLFEPGVYLDGTRFATVAHWLKEQASDTDRMRSALAPDYVQRAIQRGMRDDVAGSGSALVAGLERVLQENNLDLTVSPEGRYVVVDRADITTTLPSDKAWAWELQPTWEIADTVVRGVPREVRAYYTEKHAIQARSRYGATDPITRFSVQLEQAYAVGGNVYTLDELLAAYNLTGAITDGVIAANFLSNNFERSGLIADGTYDREVVIRTIKQDWRRLFRIKYPHASGGWGTWTDLQFGRLNADGTIDPACVESPWVELKAVVRLPQGANTLIGALTGINHFDDTAPFTASWVGDPSAGIVRLTPETLPEGATAFLGSLVEEPEIGERAAPMVDENGQAHPLAGYKLVETVDHSTLWFTTTTNIKLYMVGTRRMPNNRERWHLEKVPSRAASPDIDYVELEVGAEVFALRDYVGGSKLAAADGLGQVLNAQALKDDAERRAEVWLIEHTNPVEGEGVALGCAIVEKHGLVEGALREVTVEVDNAVVRTRLSAGNLGDRKSRERRAMQRLAERKIEAAGKVAT